jgi:signal transduction histidine kinase
MPESPGRDHRPEAAARSTGLPSAEAWRAEARAARERLAALDAATVAIAQELSLERVLQLIVDSVRPLVSARYAALGILDQSGRMDRFITSGIADETRRAIGHPPRGLGLLGVIIREARSLRVDDLGADPRSVGFPPHHPPMTTFLGVPVRVEGRAVGNLYLTEKEGGGTFSEDDEQLVETFARHAGLAIHNARMHEELRQMAVLQGRERIAQDLHDGTIQSLYAVSLSLEDTVDVLHGDPDGAGLRIDRAIDSLHATIRQIREFIMGLDPDARATIDLLAGLAEVADEFERSTLIAVELDTEPGVLVDPEETLQLIQLTREAMSNVARHAGASRVTVKVEERHDRLRLSIIDDGQGFDPASAQLPGHHGLTNMRARAEALGGSLVIESSGGKGTQVLFEMVRHDRPMEGVPVAPGDGAQDDAGKPAGGDLGQEARST